MYKQALLTSMFKKPSDPGMKSVHQMMLDESMEHLAARTVRLAARAAAKQAQDALKVADKMRKRQQRRDARGPNKPNIPRPHRAYPRQVRRR